MFVQYLYNYIIFDLNYINYIDKLEIDFDRANNICNIYIIYIFMYDKQCINIKYYIK